MCLKGSKGVARLYVLRNKPMVADLVTLGTAAE